MNKCNACKEWTEDKDFQRAHLMSRPLARLIVSLQLSNIYVEEAYKQKRVAMVRNAFGHVKICRKCSKFTDIIQEKMVQILEKEFN